MSSLAVAQLLRVDVDDERQEQDQAAEKAAQTKNGAARLTPAVLARHAGLSERELRTQSVFCVGISRCVAERDGP